MTIEILKARLAAGVPQTFHINGEYIEILDAQYPLDVQVVTREGNPMSYMKDAEASFFSRPGKWGSIILTSANAQDVRCFIGSGDAGTRRISSTVSVIDGGRARADAGVAYAGTANIAAPASNYPYGQLWNPAGSGKRLIVNQVATSLQAAGGINVYFGAASFPTDVTAVGVSCKKSQAAAAAAQLRTTIGTAQPAYTYGQMQALGGSPGVMSMWKPTEPILVLPGFGINLVGSVIAQSMAINLEWFEESL